MTEQTKLQNETEDERIQRLNLFDKKEQLPAEGKYTASFVKMATMEKWKGEDNAIFFFYLTHKGREYVAGFIGSRRPKADGLSWHLYHILTGRHAIGYITDADMSHYKGNKIQIAVVHSFAKRLNKFYLKIVGVYPYSKKEAMKK